MSATLQQLREEYSESTIGPDIHRLLDRIVRSTAPIYPPTEYSDAGIWSAEALEDLLHDWIATRLVGRGDLWAMLETAASVRSLQASLTTSLRQLLINRRRRTTSTNLYRRALDLMRGRHDTFYSHGPGDRPAEQLWSLQKHAHQSRSLRSATELVKSAFELSDEDLEVVRYGPHSLKSSPILRNPSLELFLVHLLDSAEGGLSMDEIIDVMRRRFNLVDVSVESIDAVDEPASHTAIALDVGVAADRVAARLGNLGIEVLKALAEEDGSPDAAAQRLDMTAGELRAELSRALAEVAEEADDLETARKIFRKLSESLF